MIVAMFLCKDLLVSWSYGEKYFSTKLVDIDRTQNIGNWNWSSSFGLDNASFLRIFNPWEQSAKVDPDGSYIKKWLPQLKDVATSDLHHWDQKNENYPDVSYIQPIVDHAKQRKKFIKFYRKYF
jgi:deoxyribodipyrimidine photo-lyase